MKIRKACLADAKAVQRVAYALKLHGIDWSDWHTLRVIRETISEGRYYVAELNKEIVGIVSLIRHRRTVEIGTLAVKRSFNGKGIGKKLVGFARSFAKRRRAKRITVASLVAFGAKLFYLRLGFRIREKGMYRGRKWYDFAASL